LVQKNSWALWCCRSRISRRAASVWRPASVTQRVSTPLAKDPSTPGIGFHDHFVTIYDQRSEAESKEKHSVCDPMPELIITSPYVHSRVDSNIFTYARVDFILQGLWIWPLDQSFAEKRREKTFVICRICYTIYMEWFFR
jgi:hypothetical protein